MMPNAAVIDETTLDELRRDAMRYRRIRDAADGAKVFICIRTISRFGSRFGQIAGEFADNQIDMEMSAELDDDPDYANQDRVKIEECNSRET